MSVDKKRYRQFAEEMKALQERLGMDEFENYLRAKLSDLILKETLKDISARELKNAIRQIMSSNVSKLSETLGDRYNDVLDVVEQFYADLGPRPARDWDRLQAFEKIGRQYLGEYSERMTKDIHRKVKRAISDGANHYELERQIRKLGGKAGEYANAIASSQVKSYSRIAKQEQARIAEVEYFEYVGSLRKVTRPFCRAMIGQTMHINEIKMLRNANREPVLEHCGGWRCIHDWEPDPFASESSKGSLVQVGSMKVYGNADEPKKKVEMGIAHHHFRNLVNTKKFIEKAQRKVITESEIKYIESKHADDFSNIAKEISDAQKNYDKLYYQFHKNKSTIIFEKSGLFVFINEKKIATAFKAEHIVKYKENVVKYWLEIDKEGRIK